MSSIRRSARIQASQPAAEDLEPLSSFDSKIKKRPSEPEPEAPQPASKKRGRPKTVDKAASTSTTTTTFSSNPTDTNIPSAPPPNVEPTNVFVTPLTPTTKRRKTVVNGASLSKPPPFTPTPSAVGLMASTSVSSSSPSSKPRRAKPHATNAPLLTPGGSRVAVANENGEGAAPTTTTTTTTTTTENLLEQACAHLIKVDPRLRAVIEKHPCRIFSPEGLREEVDPFESLVSGILAQQVSGAAAKSIKGKFIALFPNPTASLKFFPTSATVAATDLSLLRTAGLSGRKAEYVSGLAAKFASGELSAKMLVEASDAEVLERLVAVRGLGRWSVEMFACFGLKRMDVFSTGDLGVQRGMAAWLGRDVGKLKAKGGGKWKYLSEGEMLEQAERFAPYRSLFMWYMWRIEDVNIDAMQGS